MSKRGNRKELLCNQPKKSVSIGFRGTPELNQEIKDLAREEGMSASDLLRRIVYISIKQRKSRLKKKKEETTRDRLLREIGQTKH